MPSRNLPLLLYKLALMFKTFKPLFNYPSTSFFFVNTQKGAAVKFTASGLNLKNNKTINFSTLNKQDIVTGN
jgi:hypothetical protein